MLNLTFLTENGWPACDANSTDSSFIPGTNVRIPLQIGIPNLILKAFASDFAKNVEPLDQSQCGGWTPTNSVPTSNHLGGTAQDLNWRKHPMGKTNDGYTPEQVAKVNELIDFYEGNIFWGNNWNSPKDSMHFQMGYNTYGNPKVDDFISRKINPDGTSTFGNLATMRKPMRPGLGGTFWNDVSQYQLKPIDSTYQYRVFSFRTNTGDRTDTLAYENATISKQMLDAGQLDIVIPYYFFRPGQANCDLHREILEATTLFNHPRTVTMVDVEGDAGSVLGDNSLEINDEVNRIRGWYGSQQRVIGYLNTNADPGIWSSRGGISLVVPQYNRQPGDISSLKDVIAKNAAIAHQFTSRAIDQKPWEGIKVDVNWSPYEIDELLELFQMEATSSPPVDVPVSETPSGPVDLNSRVPSISRYRNTDKPVWRLADMIQFMDARSHEAEIERLAIYGHLPSIEQVRKNVQSGDEIALAIYNQIPSIYRDQSVGFHNQEVQPDGSTKSE